MRKGVIPEQVDAFELFDENGVRLRSTCRAPRLQNIADFLGKPGVDIVDIYLRKDEDPTSQVTGQFVVSTVDEIVDGTNRVTRVVRRHVPDFT